MIRSACIALLSIRELENEYKAVGSSVGDGMQLQRRSIPLSALRERRPSLVIKPYDDVFPHVYSSVRGACDFRGKREFPPSSSFDRK